MTTSSNKTSVGKLPAVIKYPGAKWSIAQQIIDHFPPHYHYVEPFFGSGAVFFTKSAAKHELVNDRHDLVVNFFRVLRDRTDELCWAVETTPWSRSEYDQCHLPSDDELESARRFLVRCWQGHASDFAKKTGWKNRGATQRASGMSHRWNKVPEQLAAVAFRLKDAEIENRDALEVIRRHAKPDCLIYADPPYLPVTRTQKMYAHEMTVEQHIELLEALVVHPGPVVVSGYANDLYDEMLSGWAVHTLKAPKVEKGAARSEVIWVRDRIDQQVSDS